MPHALGCHVNKGCCDQKQQKFCFTMVCSPIHRESSMTAKQPHTRTHARTHARTDARSHARSLARPSLAHTHARLLAPRTNQHVHHDSKICSKPIYDVVILANVYTYIYIYIMMYHTFFSRRFRPNLVLCPNPRPASQVRNTRSKATNTGRS